ncbi:MAG TPA: pitrilysin family protein [Gemmatimonadales bacterium]|nr:pitrilysin family protein [Gemmatimonadales bacterium]
MTRPLLARQPGWIGAPLTAGALALLSLAGGLAAQAFPTTPPKPGRLAPVRFPPFKETTLPNGVALVVIERHDEPVVSVSLSFRAGALYDPPGKEGLAELAAELLSKGTATRTAEQIAASIEGVGGHLSASAGADVLTISADALSDQAELVFTLLGDVTLHSSFPASELELARTRALSALALQLSQPGIVAERAFAREIYAPHPYGRSPTRESYRAVTTEDVVQYARRSLRPGGALLVVAGDVTDNQVRDLVAQAFPDWHGTPPVAPSPPRPPSHLASDILLVHRPGSAQANLVAGNTTTLAGDPVYYAGRVAAQVLGGGADSRLFLILREQKSWTYGAYAGLHRHRGVGYWEATAEVRTNVADSALNELLRQIERIRTETIPDSELTAAKGFLIGSFPLSIETPTQIASQVAATKLLGLGDDYLRLYRERLAAVTAAQARAAAARLFQRPALTIVVVGDGTVLYDRLRAIAPVRVVDVDGKSLTPAELHPTATAVELDATQFAVHTDSSRVLAQGNPLGFTVSEVRRVADSLVCAERSNLADGAFQQQTTVVLDARDGTVRRLDQTSLQRQQKAETHLVYAGGRVKGTSATPQQDGSVKRVEIDTALAPGTSDENAVPCVVTALPLAPGKTFTLPFFTPSENAIKLLTFKIGTPESVTVPAGTFQAFPISTTGSRVPFTMWVSTDAPRRILKSEFSGQPFVVELVK